jgi:exodeoxyribonuclease-1
MSRFAFYDFETTGTSPKFDQPLQFAAILTDDDFNPIEEVNIRCRLADHILPSPIAMAITGVSPKDLIEPNMSLLEFSRELAGLIEKWRPAIWTGYNSISFDENVFRQLFYQNLQPNLYLTHTNGNQRLDILKAVYACWGLGKSELKIPTLDNGKQTSKLDTLAPFNGFKGHNAHDALGDVKATIHIAQLIRDKIPDVWNFITGNLDKRALKNSLMTGEVFGLIERFGAAAPKIYTGIYCGTNEDNANQIGYFDPDIADVADYLSGDAELFSKAVKQSPKIIRSIDLNRMPLLFPLPDPSPEHVESGQLIKNSKVMQQATGEALAGRYADREEPELVEDKIYQGFYGYEDKAQITQFHAAEWKDRWEIVSSFADDRLKELGSRLMVLYAPEHTPKSTRDAFWELVSGRWSGDVFYGESERQPGNTYQSVRDDLEQLKPGAKFEVDENLLVQLTSYFENRKL